MKTNQGSAVIYIVLLLFVLMTSAAIVLSSMLSKHLRAAESYLSSEQAFAAANSSVEELLYQIVKQEKEDATNEGVIDSKHPNGSSITIPFKGSACKRFNEDGEEVVHISGAGTYQGLVRRIEMGGGSGECS